MFTQVSNDAKIDSLGPREEIIIAKVASEKNGRKPSACIVRADRDLKRRNELILLA